VLTPDDLELTRRDIALPGLPLLLDPCGLREVLAGLGLDRGPVEVIYLRYKPGTSVVAGLWFSAERELAFATAYAGTARPKLAKNRRYAGRARPAMFAVDEVAGLVVGSASADRWLPGVRRIGRRAGALPGLPRPMALTPLRYKPARRWVARAEDGDGPVAVVKVHPARVARALVATQRRLQAAGAPVPALLGADERGIVVTGWSPGRVLDVLSTDPTDHEVAGQALAGLHAVPALAGLRPAPDSGRQLRSAVAAVRTVAPEAGDVATATAAALLGQLPQRTHCVAVHGDFSPDQVVRGPAGAGLVDLDRAHAGDPAGDLASYLAARLCAGATYDEAAEPLLAGYAEGGGTLPPPSALRPLTATAVLALADEPFRRRHRQWRDRVHERVALAAALAGSS